MASGSGSVISALFSKCSKAVGHHILRFTNTFFLGLCGTWGDRYGTCCGLTPAATKHHAAAHSLLPVRVGESIRGEGWGE